MENDLRVHICPVGYDFVRVTEPIIKAKADKAYFILHETDRGQSKFLNQIKKELKKKLPQLQTKEYYLDIWNFNSCIQKFREIISKEKENHVYVNVSTGTKITAITGMLACMTWGARPYYVKFVHPSENLDTTIRREEVYDSDRLPVFEINKPKRVYLDILNLIEKNGTKIKKKQLIEELEDLKIIRKTDENGEESSIHSKHSQLRPLLNSMDKEWGFIQIEASGRRSIISLTDQGKNALEIFGN